jgi:hypothetical protein
VPTADPSNYSSICNACERVCQRTLEVAQVPAASGASLAFVRREFLDETHCTAGQDGTRGPLDSHASPSCPLAGDARVLGTERATSAGVRFRWRESWLRRPFDECIAKRSFIAARRHQRKTLRVHPSME